MGFAEDMKKFAEKAKLDIKTVVRKSVLDLVRDVVDLSPVDEGRFRSNWMTGVGYAVRTTVQTADKTGAPSIDRAEKALSTWTPGAVIWISNNLPYARRLEFGWSDQAPSGVARLSVQRFKDHVAEAVREVK